MEEIWKTIPGYENYQVSNLGRVFGPSGSILKLRQDRWGHLWFRASGRHNKDFKVHILVCKLFNGPKPYPEAQCLHKDDNKDNNTPDNLYWGTHKQNMQDAIRNNSVPSGNKHWNASISKEDADRIGPFIWDLRRRSYTKYKTTKEVEVEFDMYYARAYYYVRKYWDLGKVPDYVAPH